MKNPDDAAVATPPGAGQANAANLPATLQDPAFLARVPLFAGIETEELAALLQCVGARTAVYPKRAFLSVTGDAITAVGIVLSGRVQVLKEDAFGNRSILNDLGPGESFGEAFVCGASARQGPGGVFALTVSVQAVEDTTILYLDFDRVMQSCKGACAFHSRLVRNMVQVLAEKNIALTEKLEVLTKRTLRARVLAYLSRLSQEQQSRRVTSPLGRTDLADYLGADRSALTRELNAMEQAGLLHFVKNVYELSF